MTTSNRHTTSLLWTVSLLFAIVLFYSPTPSLAGTTLDVSPSPASTFICPDACTCSDITINQRDVKHARCDSTEALHDKQWTVNSLDLSGLGLTKVPAIVEKLRELTRLDLSNNQITEVARISQRVHELNLSHNKISSGKLAKLPTSLRKLNLTHNHITVVPEDLKRLEHLRELELTGNPINCSCETIHVRNWLQSRHIWTENAIKCSLPATYKGRPWLQVKQSEVCPMTPTEIEEEKNIWEDTNDLMMGDQPAAEDEDHHEEEEEKVEDFHDHHDHDQQGLLEDDYMPYEDDPRASSDDLEGSGHGLTHEDPMMHKPTFDTEVEGSGSVVRPRISADHVESSTTPPGGDDEEDDGSGDALIPLVPISRGNLGHQRPDSDFHDEDENEDEDHRRDDHDDPIEEPEGEPTPPGAAKGLGIFGNGMENEHPVTESTIVKDKAPEVGAAPDTTRILGGTDKGASLHNAEKTDEADATKLYILLGMILIVMIGLIVFVVVKQKNARRRNNRRGQDVENAKDKELQDMNKRLIGKPLEKNNGTAENAPLIGDRDKSDFARPINGQRDCDKIGFNPYEKPASPLDEKHIPLKGRAEDQPHEEQKQQSPAMESFKPNGRAESKDSINEEGNNNNNNEDMNNNNQFHPIQNGYPQENGISPHSPPMETSPASVHKTKKDEDWEKYTPRSPDMKRYSPVYSPDTGRVKIKMAEMPKPKTPLLVTRSRSNAGQIITTPNLNQRPQRPVMVAAGDDQNEV